MRCGAPSTVSIRDFAVDLDSRWLHDLWHRTLDKRWAVSIQAMLNTLSDAVLLLVAECEGLRSGFCAVDSRHEGTAALMLMLVEPDRQHRRIGTELLSLVEATLREQKVGRLVLGAGNGDYFWPGIPQEQDGAWSFFERRGFQEEEPSADLIQALEGFQVPDWVSARQLATGMTLHLAKPAQRSQITSFEERYFPAWADYYQSEMKQGHYNNILLAQGPDGSILGTILMRDTASFPWLQASGMRQGTLNVLGVAPEKQGQGIGLALTAGAMEHLRGCGCSSCHVQWTGLTEWYGKLGAKPWAQYRMAYKSL